MAHIRNSQYSPKHLAEYYLTRMVLPVVNALPLRAVHYLGAAVAFVLFYLVRFRIKTAFSRIEKVFGDRYSLRERLDIAWISLRNAVFSILELLRFRMLSADNVAHHPLSMFGRELFKLYQQKSTFIIAVPHTGNWELGAAVLALSGVPCVVIVKRQKNLLVDELINQMRSSVGIEVFYNDSIILKRVIKCIRKGKVLLIAADTHSRTESSKVDFFGGKANLGTGAAFFARKTGCHIYPAMLLRHGWNGHDFKLFDPVYPDYTMDRETDMQRIMLQLMSVFDREIRELPEQYLWYNKRWVLDPAWNMPLPAKMHQTVSAHGNINCRHS